MWTHLLGVLLLLRGHPGEGVEAGQDRDEQGAVPVHLSVIGQEVGECVRWQVRQVREGGESRELDFGMSLWTLGSTALE